MHRGNILHLSSWGRLALGLVLLAGLFALTGGLTAKAATTITVSTCDEASLDGALSSATNGNTIDFGCSGTINITSTLVISQSITLDGSGQQVSINGGGNVQILQVNSGVNFTLYNLTISNGFSSSSGTGTGGGLYNNGGSVSITKSTFTGNKAQMAGGSLDNTGGGSVLITNSTFNNNSAINGGGGGIDNGNGRMVITDSTFTNNAANNGAGGGLFNLNGSVSITNSTFSSNLSANEPGGGLFNYSGGTVTITNSTFANNSAFSGGGIANQGGSGSITNSTIANNNGGGINTTFSLAGNLLANNSPANCSALGFTDNGYNLSSDNFCHLSGTGDQQGVDPKLDSKGLQSNGGYTQTIALQQGSPAIDAEASGCPSTDQRGVTRPDVDVSESSCDIGAYESMYAQADTTAPTLQLPSTVTVNATSPQGAAVSYTVSATDPDNPSSQLSLNCSPVSGSQFAIGNTTVNCSASDPAGNSTSGSFTVVVQPVLTASGTSVSATEGSAFSGVVATGTAYGPGALSASINWGDGNTSAGTVTLNSDGSYSVKGSHTYSEEGSFAINVTVSGSGVPNATASSSASVADAALTANTPRAVVKGTTLTLATTFTDADPSGTLSDYTASIAWGDRTTSAATIGSSSTSFSATGTHKYAKHGTYTIMVTIKDAGGSSVTKTLTITV